MQRSLFICLLLAVGAGSSSAQNSATSASPSAPVAGQTDLVADPSSKGVLPPVVQGSNHPELTGEQMRHIPYGVCGISLIVDVRGMPQDLKIVRSNNPVFANACLLAAAKARFKPAKTGDGQPIAYRSTLTYGMTARGDDVETSSQTKALFHTSFRAPPGATTSSGPDADGVYPLSIAVDAPRILRFEDKGFVEVSVQYPDHTACEVLLTISAKGKPSDPKVIDCERPLLEKPIVESLINSQYKPGEINGKRVAVRAAVHIELTGFGEPGK